ncbi:hypothetical protein JVX90_00385 [Gordonia sp. PDNC005]|uniref:hypothetical protein n=1 Tax=Gordonia sp. PDNC005 TaxID=2811424 RepID=UPI0019642ECD|nr:hypothetical protein [Gordonia sp. PDNC005]QRY62770.1 hypothetical protein JVX90_00385 [Gordonia sp. PDNC005]
MIRRGDWVPLLPKLARIAVVSAVPAELIIRGADYVLPGEGSSHQLTVVESAMPLWVWGTLCLGFGLTQAAGLLGRWRRVTAAALWLGGVLYVALAAGQWWAVADVPFLDGFRGPGIVSIFCLAQLGMGAGYSLQPDERDVQKAVENGETP